METSIEKNAPRKLCERWRRKEGEGCVFYLLADQASGALESLNKDIPVSVVLNALSCESSKLRNLIPRREGVTVDRREDGTGTGRVVFSVDEGWEVEIAGPGGGGVNRLSPSNPSVNVRYSTGGAGGCYELQDTPDGKPAVVIVGVSAQHGGGGVGVSHFSYVRQEIHYSCGEIWNPKPHQPAEVFYYDSGKIRHHAQYRQGRVCSPDANTPCRVSYWKNGSIQAVEFGDAERGRYRDIKLGPAYAEYFPNGIAALEVFSELRSDGATEAVRWICRKVDGASRKAGEHDLRAIFGEHVTPAGRESMGVELDPLAGFVLRHGDPSEWGGIPAEDSARCSLRRGEVDRRRDRSRRNANRSQHRTR